MNLWDLGAIDQACLLGLFTASRSTLARYCKGAALDDNVDLLGIHKALRIIFPHNRDLVYRWVRTSNRRFGGRSPMETMRGGYEGVLAVRRYLDFERGGKAGSVSAKAIDRGSSRSQVLQSLFPHRRLRCLLIRNIKGIRTSQHLFDDLAESDAEHVLATLTTEQDLHDTRSALISRPFDYGGAVITYPFVPQNWQATRFSDGARYGVWYGSLAIETTVYDTAYHWRRFVADSFPDYDAEICADRRVTCRCAGILVDLRGKEAEHPDLAHRDSYFFTHAVGRYLSAQRQNGVLVISARHQPGPQRRHLRRGGAGRSRR